MKKIIFFLIILIFPLIGAEKNKSPSLHSQLNPLKVKIDGFQDFKWGMTMKQVKDILIGYGMEQKKDIIMKHFEQAWQGQVFEIDKKRKIITYFDEILNDKFMIKMLFSKDNQLARINLAFIPPLSYFKLSEEEKIVYLEKTFLRLFNILLLKYREPDGVITFKNGEKISSPLSSLYKEFGLDFSKKSLPKAAKSKLSAVLGDIPKLITFLMPSLNINKNYDEIKIFWSDLPFGDNAIELGFCFASNKEDIYLIYYSGEFEPFQSSPFKEF